MITKIAIPAGDPKEIYDSFFARLLKLEKVELTDGIIGSVYFTLVMPA